MFSGLRRARVVPYEVACNPGTMTTQPPPTNPVDACLAMVSFYPGPAEKLAALQALGTPLELLVKVSISLHPDAGEALLAVPAPLPLVLEQVPAKVAEQALLGFTIQDFLETSEVKGTPALQSEGWAATPSTLLALYRQEHPKIFQVLYLGTLLTWPQDPARWARAIRIMAALAHPRAESPEYAPVTPTISALYDAAPADSHPYLYFQRQTIPR